jgi:hypothetical protein
MTPNYACAFNSCSCSETGHTCSSKKLYLHYPYTSTIASSFIAVVPANSFVGPKKSSDSLFSMLASERSFDDMWNRPEEDILDKL